MIKICDLDMRTCALIEREGGGRTSDDLRAKIQTLKNPFPDLFDGKIKTSEYFQIKIRADPNEILKG